MIRSLNQQAFREFGTILTEKSSDWRYANHHSISLSAQKAPLYQTVADTWLTAESGATILSVSTDNKTFFNFYLDKPVWLHGGVWFTLTGFRGSSTVQLSAFSMPRLLETRPVKDGFLIRPRLQVTTLYTFFYQEKEQGFLFPGESHNSFELTYVDSDTLHSVADGLDLKLEQGDLVLYDKDQWHMQYADMDVAPRFVTITFDAEGYDLTPLLNRKFKLPRKVQPLLQMMLREQEASPLHSTDMILSLLQVLLITLLREQNPSADKVQSSNSINSENEIVRKALQYMKFIEQTA